MGLLANIIPPVAALFLGLELIATTKLQTEMVYEIAAAYGLDLEDPARRGEAIAIFGLSLGADAIKTGLTVVEILPGIGAVVGASTNAAMLYVLGQTANRFYQNKAEGTKTNQTQQETEQDWQKALQQSAIVDGILARMVKVTYSKKEWKEILPTIEKISPTSAKTVSASLESKEDLDTLLSGLRPEFAPLAFSRCYQIAKSNGEISSKEQEILNRIAIKFDLDTKALIKD